MCKLLFKGVRLINSVAVHHIYTTQQLQLFFFPQLTNCLMTQLKKQHLITQRAARLSRDDLCRPLLMAILTVDGVTQVPGVHLSQKASCQEHCWQQLLVS